METISDLTLGSRLRRARRAARVSLERAAEVIGREYQTIWNYERGRSVPRVNDLMRLATLYGTTVSWLISEGGTPSEASSTPLAGRIAELPPEYRTVLEEMVKVLEKGRRL